MPTDYETRISRLEAKKVSVDSRARLVLYRLEDGPQGALHRAREIHPAARCILCLPDNHRDGLLPADSGPLLSDQAPGKGTG
jgi:hypothetical protein